MGGHGRAPAPAGRADDELAAALAPFDAIAAAMAEVRAVTPPLSGRRQAAEDRREAYMRTVLRAARKEYERVAVVCGAWHVPALTAPAADRPPPTRRSCVDCRRRRSR